MSSMPFAMRENFHCITLGAADPPMLVSNSTSSRRCSLLSNAWRIDGHAQQRGPSIPCLELDGGEENDSPAQRCFRAQEVKEADALQSDDSAVMMQDPVRRRAHTHWEEDPDAPLLTSWMLFPPVLRVMSL